jgi:accessory gene regulator B
MKPSEYFADVMQKNHVIAVDEYELYQYSLNALFEMAGNIIFSILIGVLFHKLPMTLLFLMVVIPWRSVLGGCHAKTAGACFVLSLSVLFGCVLLPFYLTGISVWIVSFSFIILEVLLWIIAPVECKNKPFIGNQKKRCQTYSKVIILLLGALFMAFLFMKMSEYLLEIWLILVYFSATILIELHKKLRI